MEKNKLHYVVATGILIKDDKFLIVKRSEKEKAYPGRWTVPGGKLVTDDYINEPYDTKDKLWYNVLEKLLKREVKEEVNLDVGKIQYLLSLAYLRSDGFPTIIISLFSDDFKGDIKLCEDLTEYTWVTLEEAKNYDLIEGIHEEIELVDKRIKGGHEDWTGKRNK